MLKITALSDTHGWLPEVEPCNILLIAGDICPIDNHNIEYQQRWLRESFGPWLERLPADHIIGIAGNHDFVFEHQLVSKSRYVPPLPWTYLLDSSVEVRGLKIYGSPWVPNLPSWAFYGDDATLKSKWDAIPDDIDILMTHGPPHGFGDRTGFKYGNRAVGSSSLTAASIYRVEPKLHVFGHIHEARGTWKVPHGELANVAMVDEDYRRMHKPTEFIWDIYGE